MSALLLLSCGLPLSGHVDFSWRGIRAYSKESYVGQHVALPASNEVGKVRALMLTLRFQRIPFLLKYISQQYSLA